MSQQGLDVSDVVNVTVNLSPIAAATRNFGSLLILGSSNIIDVVERIRKYTSITAVGNDYGMNSDEYKSALRFLSQLPKPSQLYIGRWAQTATAALLHGGALSAAEQLPSFWTGVTTGSTRITIDGTLRTLSALNFSSVTNMNGVAAVINTALGANGTCTWNSVYSRLEIAGTATGGGTHASGAVTFGGNVAPADTLTIQGTAVTFVASGATGNQVNIGASATATAAALLAFLSTSVDANLSKMTYALDVTGLILTVTAITLVAATGNAYTLAKSSTNLTVSGATLAGGVTGATMSYGSATGSGVDITGLANLDLASGASTVQGVNAETLLQGVLALEQVSGDWYGLYVCDMTHPVTADYLAVAGNIEASTPTRIFGVTSQDTAILSAASSTDLPSLLKAAGYNRSFTQYSSTDPQAAASIFGRAFTVNFSGQNTTITVKFKQEPGIAAETISETQAATLKAKNCNVFVNYSNDTAIIQEGVMASGFFFDEVHGTDWLQDNVQNALYNELYGTTTKVPQTDAGVSQLVTAASKATNDGVTNGLIAPGVWGGPPVGVLKTGQTLSSGYYVYAPPVSSQSDAARAARIAPTMQIAAKLAGAIHFANVVINVNR